MDYDLESMKNILSMKSIDHHKLDSKMLEYVRSNWIDTDEGKEAKRKFGINKSQTDEKINSEK